MIRAEVCADILAVCEVWRDRGALHADRDTLGDLQAALSDLLLLRRSELDAEENLQTARARIAAIRRGE